MIELDRAHWARGGALPPEPMIWCRHCYYPLSAHEDGCCEDGGTFGPLALGPDSYRWHDVPDSWGEGLFAFWLADYFDPPIYVARGDSWSDAYEWWTEYMAESGRITDATDDLSPEDRAALESGEGVTGYEFVDGQDGIFYLELADGRWLAGVDR